MIKNNGFLWHRRVLIFIVAVIAANVYTTHGQSYLLALGQNPHIFFEQAHIYHPQEKNSTLNFGAKGMNGVPQDGQDDQNSTIILIKKTYNSSSGEISQVAMDVITVVWYVATFLALAAFFLLMACSDRRCNRARSIQSSQSNETPHPPPTPSPSYSEFAPPSYETVMKMQNGPSIYVIPFPLEEGKDGNNNGTVDSQTSNSPVTFYTVNELEKLGS